MKLFIQIPCTRRAFGARVQQALNPVIPIQGMAQIASVLPVEQGPFENLPKRKAETD